MENCKPIVTNKNIIGSSETLRAVCSEKISNINTTARSKQLSTLQFSHWLAGLIDGKGSLLLSPKNYSSCVITVGEKQYQTLQLVKSRLGGCIKRRTGTKAYRWRLHKKSPILQLIKLINGKLHVPQRQLQLHRVCAVLQVKLLPVNRISQRNGWVAGFCESRGHFNVNFTTLQCSITLSQKDATFLLEISAALPGQIYYDKCWDGWLYVASSLKHISCWVKYFSVFPLRSWKQVQLQRFKRVLLYKSRDLHSRGPAAGRSWKRFQRLLQEFRQEA